MNLSCPTCGERVTGVYHGWNTLTDTATFEYFHVKGSSGYRRRPCVVQMSIEDGRKRMDEETTTVEVGDIFAKVKDYGEQ